MSEFVKGFYKKAKVQDTSEVTDYIYRPNKNLKNVSFSPMSFDPTPGPDQRQMATMDLQETAGSVKRASFFDAFFGKMEESDKPPRPFWPEGWPAPKQIRGTASMFEQDVDIERDIATSGFIL